MTNVLTWMVENWAIIIVMAAIIVAIIVAVKKFLELPSTEQVAKVKECLLAWVFEAETELGGGTGAIKLRTVYGWFVTAFPILKNFISFELFSKWVDDALDTMEEMLKNNNNLKQVVEGNVLTVVNTETSE